MDILQQGHMLLSASPLLFYTLVAILAVCVGSFINVVSYRHPKMLEAAWRAEYESMTDTSPNFTTPRLPTFNLCWPSSHCPKCEKKLAWYLNIPILSYLACKGCCYYCKAPIPARYLWVELITPIFAVLVAWRFGVTLDMLWVMAFTGLLITLTIIDLETFLLPDQLVYSLLWLGLLQSVFGVFATPSDAILGAVLGYGVLWSIAKAFLFLTRKEGMGYGDFKLLAACGAWLGPWSLPIVLLIASVLGSLFGIALLLFTRHSRHHPIPFGPFIALGGFITLMAWPFQPVYDVIKLIHL